MADKSKRVPENVSGKFYVDENCSACSLCSDEAPDFFKMTDDEDHAFVYKQPENGEEEEDCREQIENCPEEAIGGDG